MSTKVLLNRPNLIGYLRLILLFLSIFSNNYLFIILYATSVSLDYFDGMIARLYNETTVLGSCLDMITDRITTTILCAKIMSKKIYLSKNCLIFIFFDILSHFLYFIGKTYNRVSHKKEFSNVFLNFYYNNIVLKVLCVGTEISFLMLYILDYNNKYLTYLFIIPGIKTLFHIAHFYVGLIILSY